MKRMEVEGRGVTHTKKTLLAGLLLFAMLKVGYCKFMGGGGYICFRGVGG